MESLRQQKIAQQIHKDLGEIFIKECAEILRGALTTVTAVRITPDLSIARVYVSVFPWDKHEAVMNTLEANNRYIRKVLGARVRNQLRIVPELQFMIDDSLEYIQNIEGLLKEEK
ncbi:MAG: 30S ribosome-binding factor RbfA [Rikenellaceae bacterium]|jgi:ribosome-binding factor A|nr:30S ribosome-binding factor RbfA [Rikenellaceae bacterium]